MALILALILGLYWIIRISSEKSQTKKIREDYETHHREEEILRDSWEESVINKSLEEELEDRLYHRDESLIQEVSASWDTYFQYTLPETYIVRKKRNSYYITASHDYYDDLTALRILLSNRGFLTWHDAKLGIDLVAVGDTAVQKAYNYKDQRDFIVAMDENLKKHGVDEEMYSSVSLSQYNIFPPSDPDYHCDMCKVQWKPEIPDSYINFDKHRRKRD